MNPEIQKPPPAPIGDPDVARIPARPQRRRGFGIRTGIVALALTGIWHVFWVMAFAPRPDPPHRGAPSAPRMIFAAFPASPEEAQADARALWSPVLFSLPMPMGFSQPMLDGRVGARPPLGEAEPVSWVMSYEGESASTPAVRWPWRLADLVGESLFQVAPPSLGEPAFRLPPEKGTAVLRVERGGELAGRRFKNEPRLDSVKGAGERAWEITAFVEADEQGGVTHVFLETPSPFAEINRAVERALRQARLEPGPPVRGGRLVIGSSGVSIRSAAEKAGP